MNPFDFVDSVSYSKKDLVEDTPSLIKEYTPYIVNKALSYHLDSLQYANDMNRFSHLEPLLQYYFYLNTLKSRKRFAKWVKKTDNDDLVTIREYYKCNPREAEEIMRILSPEDIQKIKTKISKGGKINE